LATSLHQQLKDHYVADTDQHEVDVAGYRIDAIDSRGVLIEIQCAGLSAIRDKIRSLVADHDVVVVKPLAARKKITTLHRRGGDVVSSRFSPVRQSLSHIFLELVHFGVFPHPRLRLDVLLTEQEEIRVPPTERSSWRKKYSVDDRRLITVHEHMKLRTAQDLWQNLGLSLPEQFTTADMQQTSGMPRWLAQKAAWCFRRMNFLEACGKTGNSIVYQLTRKSRQRRRKSA
jgi:hypothetical protein